MSQRKAIAVKVATVKVIKALEASLAKIESDYANEAVNEAKFDKATAKWAKEVFALALKQTTKATNVKVSTRYDNNINIDFDLPANSFVIPAEPEKDYETIGRWDYKTQTEEIGNALRILKMTDEELVSASTFGSVAKYL